MVICFGCAERDYDRLFICWRVDYWRDIQFYSMNVMFMSYSGDFTVGVNRGSGYGLRVGHIWVGMPIIRKSFIFYRSWHGG